MKKLIKILGVLIIVIIFIVFLLPFIFKGRIAEVVKMEVNERLNAKVEFSSIKLSLLRSFPDMSVMINDLSIVGIGEFEGDTLANIDKAYTSVNLMSMIRGNEYQVNSIKIDHPDIRLMVTDNGDVNWDIQRFSDADATNDSTEHSPTSSYTLTIKSLKINDGSVVFHDNGTNTHVVIKGMNHSLSGDLTASSTTLLTHTSIDEFSVNYDQVPYFVNSRIDLEADIDADLVNMVYTLIDNKLMINDVSLGMDGWVSIKEEAISMDMKLNSKETGFKDILSLIPAVYRKDFDDVEAEGIFSIDGFVKGIYEDGSWPSFGFNLNVTNGLFNYPDLPSGISDINIVSNISNVGGSLDNTVISVQKMNFRMAENPLNITLKLKTPISDPYLDLTVNGDIDLRNVKNVYHLEENEEISGKIITDFNFAGQLSAVEAGDIKNFEASGFAEIGDLNYRSAQYPSGVHISKSRLDIFKDYIDLKSFDCTIGSSDIGARGRIENYLAYIFYGETIIGKFAVLSKHLNLDELTGVDSPRNTEENEENMTMGDTLSVDPGVIVIPDNIDFFLTSSISELVYGKMEMKDVKGIIRIHNQEIILQNLKMRMFGGRMEVNGVYESKDPRNPTVDFNLKLMDLDVQETYNTWAIMQTYIPAVEKTEGSYSSAFNIKTGLNANMMPRFATLTGAGDLLSSKILVNDIQFFNQLADILKIDQLKNMMIDPVNVNFEFLEGALMVKPFNFTMANIEANLGGTTSLDRHINYVMSMKIPREAFGDSFNDVYQSLLGKTGDLASFLDISFVNLDVIIGGTLDNPTIKTGLKESMENVVEDIKNKEAEKYIAIAEEEAQKIMNEARARADDIKDLASQAADRINYEADTNAIKLIEEGKKNGMLAEIAAKAAAGELKKEANSRANQIISEADKHANAIMGKAREQADAIVNEAKERYNVK